MEFDNDDGGQGPDIKEEAYGDVDEALNDFGNVEVVGEVIRNDCVVFIVDCSQEIFKPIGDQRPQFQEIIRSYESFLKSKIISNPNDKVGLMLYNVKNTNNQMKFSNIFMVDKIDIVSAERIKNCPKVFTQFNQKYGFTDKKVPIYEVLWASDKQLSSIQRNKFNTRLFLFTCEDSPHSYTSTEKDQANNHAKKLADLGVQIELFPLKKSPTSRFDLRKFYIEILTLDIDEINEAVLDTSDKVLDLQQRLRQKEFKKRTLNRQFLNLGDGLKIGVKIYGLYRKATKPLPKKLDPRTNKPVKRVVKTLNSNGDILHESDIGTFYPLGGEKAVITKADLARIKQFDEPGMTLVGFKPRKKLKVYHNYRTSYFIYPDEERVVGSSALFDALIKTMIEQEIIGIVKFIAKKGSQLRICALLPQKQSYDEDHFQSPPGFNLIFLPYSEDINTFTGEKTIAKPAEISEQLVHVCKLLINNLTISDFDLRNFDNPNLQKFYSYLQAHALGEKEVDDVPDLLRQDEQGMLKCSDIIQMIRQTLHLELDGDISNNVTRTKKESSSEDEERPVKRAKGSKKESKSKEIKEEMGEDMNLKHIEELIRQGQFNKVKVPELKAFLKSKGLQTTGNKQQLIDRIVVYLSST